MKGAFDGALRGIELLKAEGLPFQVNTTITRHNVQTAGQIYELAIRLGAVAWHPFLLVPTGRGAELAPQAGQQAEDSGAPGSPDDVANVQNAHGGPRSGASTRGSRPLPAVVPTPGPLG